MRTVPFLLQRCEELFRYGFHHHCNDLTRRGVDGQNTHMSDESFRHDLPIDRTSVFENLQQNKMCVLRNGQIDKYIIRITPGTAVVVAVMVIIIVELRDETRSFGGRTELQNSLDETTTIVLEGNFVGFRTIPILQEWNEFIE